SSGALGTPRRSRTADERRDPMAAADRAFHEAGERFGVLAGEFDAWETSTDSGPEREHLLRAVHGVAPARVALVRPRHGGGMCGVEWLTFGIHTIELAAEHLDAVRVTQMRGGASGTTGHELCEDTGRRGVRVGRGPGDVERQVGDREAGGTLRFPESR